MKTVAVIQARMGSLRLPGKVLADVHGRPMLSWLLDRVKAVQEIDEIILATTENTPDDVLEKWALSENISCYRGADQDVLDRYLRAAETCDAEIIVRITADDPLKDPDIMRQAIKMLHDNPTVDYCSNTLNPTYPEGIDIEVFRYATLVSAHQNATLLSEREHVTPYIWKNPEKFTIKTFQFERDLSHWRWTVDKPEDLMFVRSIYERFRTQPLVPFMDIVAFIDENRILLEKNQSNTIRNEGYFKSLNKDALMQTPITNRICGNELSYVQDVLNTEFQTSSGSVMMRRFEEAFSKKIGAKYGIAFINGTATMHAALEALHLGPGDEVIVPPLTMSATTFAVLQANATPIFADVDYQTFQIDPESIRTKITSRTRAIITVALYGLSPDMDPIMALAKQHDLTVIEDNAESVLATYKGRIVGTLGHCSSFSFQSSKHLTSGEGGMFLTDNLSFAENVRKVQSLGYAGVSATKGKITKRDIQDPHYARHVSMGWNYRMPELCCAVALAQTENMDSLIQRRIEVANIFEDVTREFHDWFTPQYVGSEYTHSYWTWVVRLDTTRVGWHQFRDTFLENGGDGVYAAWKLTYLEPMFLELNLLGREKFISSDNLSQYKEGLCPVAERIQPQLLQFKTNYWDITRAYQQADILKRTLLSFDRC